MQQVTPYVEHGPDGTEFVAAYGTSGTTSRMPFVATGPPRVVLTRTVLPDGTLVEVRWPDVMREALTLPPQDGTWRREGERWVTHDPQDPGQAELLVQTVPDPPEHRQAALEARIAALEAALARK